MEVLKSKGRDLELEDFLVFHKMDTLQVGDASPLCQVHQLVIFCVQFLKSRFDRQLPIGSRLKSLELDLLCF